MQALLCDQLQHEFPDFQFLSQQDIEKSLGDEVVARELGIIPGDFGISINVIFNHADADKNLSERFSPDSKLNQKHWKKQNRPNVSGAQVGAFLDNHEITTIPKNSHGDQLIPLHSTGVLTGNATQNESRELSTVFFYLEIKRSAVYLWGKYCKYQRGLSQSPWYIEGHREGSASVEELIAEPFATATGSDLSCQAASYKFHSAGREDIDVRMLGAGRPFVVELLGKPTSLQHNYCMQVYERFLTIGLQSQNAWSISVDRKLFKRYRSLSTKLLMDGLK